MTHKYHVWVIFLHGNGTGIGMGELLHHLQALPALPRVGAGEDFARRGGEDPLGLSPTERDTVDVRVGQIRRPLTGVDCVVRNTGVGKDIARNAAGLPRF